MLIYGPPASGKTTFAAAGPGSVIVDCENGALNVHGAFTPYLCKWQDIRSALQALLTEEHQFNVVAIDTIDWCLRRIEEEVSGSSSDNPARTVQKSHDGYGNGRLVMRNYVYQQLLPMLDQLTQRKVAVLLLAHSRLANITDEGVAVKARERIGIQKAAPDIADGFLEIIVEWSDLVGYIYRDGDERKLIVNDQMRVLAKNRMGLSDGCELSWDAIMRSACNG